MLKQTLAALAVGAMMAAAPAAQAVVTYTLTDQVFGATGPLPDAFRGHRMTFSFVVSDAAVARGTFNVTFSGIGSSLSDNTFAGDTADFVSLKVQDQPIQQNLPIRAALSTLNVTFAPDLSVSTLALDFTGDSDGLILRGSGGSQVSGTYSSDFNNCQGQCTVSGRLVATVPEPMSLALLGMGLLGMVALRRQG